MLKTFRTEAATEGDSAAASAANVSTKTQYSRAAPSAMKATAMKAFN